MSITFWSPEVAPVIEREVLEDGYVLEHHLNEVNLSNTNALAVLGTLSIPLEYYGSMPAQEFAFRCWLALRSSAVKHSEGVATRTFDVKGKCKMIEVGRPPEYLQERISALMEVALQEGAKTVSWG